MSATSFLAASKVHVALHLLPGPCVLRLQMPEVSSVLPYQARPHIDHQLAFHCKCWLQQNLASLGLRVPTEVQQAALPVILSGKNAAIQSYTGSGKVNTSKTNLLIRHYC